MATAALHKATMQPETSDAYAEYSKVALAHQNLALSGYIPAVSNPNRDNSISLFAVSLLSTVWAFASRRLPEGLNRVKLELAPTDFSPGLALPLDSPTAAFIEIIMIVRGIYAVILTTDKWLQGEIEELLRYPRPEELPPHSPDVDMAFDLLAKAIDDPQLVTQKDDSASLKPLYREQLEALRRISRCRSLVEWDGHIFSWLIMAPPALIQCLKQAQPMALALFAYWAAMLRIMDHHWWAAGWPLSLVVDVLSRLGPAWGPYLEWPRKQVGLVFQDATTYETRRNG
jgi:hypothetical protein